MPDPRPLFSLRFGNYDDPPATSSVSTPRTRHPRLQRALRATADIDATMNNSSQSSVRNPGFLASARRRPRSPESRESTASGVDPEDLTRRHSHKRRRLDSDAFSPHEPPIKYGYYGQVEAGRLRMQLISCDGGTHKDTHSPRTHLGPHNVLKHDKSVYCSLLPSISITLCHADNKPFCLEKLHVVGPENGFTAPVRGGTVYVAMTMKDLKPYTDAPPQNIYSPSYRRRRSLRSSPEQISLHEALRDSEVGDTLRNVAEARERGSGYRYAMPATSQPRRTYRDDDDDDNDDGSGQSDTEANCENHMGPLEDPSQANPDNVSVTLLSDDEPGPEEESSADLLHWRQERTRLVRRRPDRRFIENPWSTDPYLDGNGEWTGGLSHIDSMMANRLDPSHRDDPDEHATPNSSHRRSNSDETSENSRSLWFDPNVTRARFHIRTGKHKVAIKFDPPVSGRFILVKMSAGCANVDVQTIIAKGYGGSRFFPAMEFR